MLSRILGVIFTVKQLFTKNYLLPLHITLILVHFNSFEVVCSQSLKVSKSYKNNQVTSIKKLLRVFKILATLLHQPNLTLTAVRNMHTFYRHSYSEKAIQQCSPTAKVSDIVQYIVLHPLFSRKAFLMKLFKSFEEPIYNFFIVTSNSLVIKFGHSA